MGSSPSPPTVSPEFLALFRARADADGTLSFARFMELALYDPHLGYYRQPRRRVGRTPGTDFFTATSSGSLFGELVSAACMTLLRQAGRSAETHTFIELGAEPGGNGVLTDVAHPFRSVRTLRLGDAIELSGDCVVFSNELFDAQPFVRTVFRDGRWRELRVALRGNALVEVEADSAPPTSPAEQNNYHFDQPLAAAELAERIAAQPWHGLFVAIDYGKTLRELLEATPAGTARAYFRHTQSNDLLARPGEQDLTCHICWDWLTDALRRHGFRELSLDFQEAFFIRHAGDFIAAVSAAEASRLSQRKLALMQLLHPSRMGQKFQVLHAIR